MTSKLTEFSSIFTPKKNQPVQIGKETIYVYPAITADMNMAERSFGFLVTQSALEAADVPMKSKLQIIGDLTHTSSLIGILQERFIDQVQLYIRKATKFEVLSYHGQNGKIQTAMDTDGNLLPTHGVVEADRRPADIYYAKISCDISFSDIDPFLTSVHPFTYFVRLMNETQNVTDENNNDAGPLTTFFGAINWAQSTDQAVVDAVLDSPKSLKQPFQLEAPAIEDALADATINLSKSRRQLEQITLEATWPLMMKSIFDQICPNFTSDPSRVIQSIQQLSFDENGNKVTLSVTDYFQAIMRLTNFLPKSGQWPIDVVHHFITHLDQTLQDGLHSQQFIYNAANASKQAYDQILALQKAFAVALTCEKQDMKIQTIAESTVKSNQAFMTNVNASRAETTISRIKSGQGCWGCGGTDHRFVDKNKKVTCPNAHMPGVKERAEKARQAYLAKRFPKKDGKKTDRDNLKAYINYASKSMNNEDIRSLYEYATKKLKTSHTTEDNGSINHPICFYSDVIEGLTGKKDNISPIYKSFPGFICLPNNIEDKLPLPIQVDSLLPHINFAVGTAESKNNISMPMAFDTCAVLNVGYADYHLQLAKRFPHIVKNITYAKDKYTPLLLSGVVANDGGNSPTHTTSLPIVIEYHLPYKTKFNQDASLKIALGREVAVNTIIGLATIKAAKMHLDFHDNVVDVDMLMTDPFPVTYKKTSRFVPDVSAIDTKMNTYVSNSKEASMAQIDKCIDFLAVYYSDDTSNKKRKKDLTNNEDMDSSDDKAQYEKVIKFDEKVITEIIEDKKTEG